MCCKLLKVDLSCFLCKIRVRRFDVYLFKVYVIVLALSAHYKNPVRTIVTVHTFVRRDFFKQEKAGPLPS